MSFLRLRSSTMDQEGPFHASKWLKHQFLIDEEEMVSFLDAIGDVLFFHASGPVSASKASLSKQDFLQVYRSYILAIKNGEAVDEKELRRFFCNYLTNDASCLYQVELPQDRVLIKVAKPVVQMQFHHFFASNVDGKFHSMVMTKESVHWGIQLSFPQIFQDPKTHEYFKVSDSTLFSNVLLFKKVISWLRHHAVPTPFLFRGEKTRVPFRLGKKCFPWIDRHPGLKEKNIFVDVT